MSDLEKEITVYNKQLPSLLKDEGKFVVIYGEDIIGVYSAYDDALKAGYEKALLNPFLVKKIRGTELIAHFTREIIPRASHNSDN